MSNAHWQLTTPLNAIIFDCDGTLSTIEGIDELARHNGAYDIVKSVTAEAMGQSGINPHLYEKRLDLVKPSQAQVQALGQQYFTHQVPDAARVIQILTRLGKSIYLVSAGLYPAVALFGELLQIPNQHIYAVGIHFDEQGQYLSFEQSSPLVTRDGKRTVVTQLKEKHEHIMHVGDGLNDYVAHDMVTRFVGFGGAYYRENLAASCDYYIRCLSMSPLLPLALTSQECAALNAEELALYHKGLNSAY